MISKLWKKKNDWEPKYCGWLFNKVTILYFILYVNNVSIRYSTVHIFTFLVGPKK